MYDQEVIGLLMNADDIVLIASSHDILEHMAASIDQATQAWYLDINISEQASPVAEMLMHLTLLIIRYTIDEWRECNSN